ncbi:hypothetical protein BDY19DRAFT_941113 [Irpex rosettiformis]|uniref:Uncharacterized protein n=1 Tax=Irpex rosettiformis TaxID=378272 RepID=A0ACB8U6K6_9APHY|nr:hypothetical protein BDY19DRAFT_941113 [Irpex rosettiformis]
MTFPSPSHAFPAVGPLVLCFMICMTPLVHYSRYHPLFLTVHQRDRWVNPFTVFLVQSGFLSQPVNRYHSNFQPFVSATNCHKVQTRLDSGPAKAGHVYPFFMGLPQNPLENTKSCESIGRGLLSKFNGRCFRHVCLPTKLPNKTRSPH